MKWKYKIINEAGFIPLLACAFVFVVIVLAGVILASLGMGGNQDNSSNSGSLPAGSTAQLEAEGEVIEMPATEGKFGNEEYLDGLAYASYCSDEEKEWYMNMRWPASEWAFSGQTRNADSTWSLYAAKKVIIENPENGKRIVTAICEAGPAPWAGSSWQQNLPASCKSDISCIYEEAQNNPPSFWTDYLRFDPPEADGRVAGLPPIPREALGASQDNILKYGFAIDQSLPVGPLN